MCEFHKPPCSFRRGPKTASLHSVAVAVLRRPFRYERNGGQSGLHTNENGEGKNLRYYYQIENNFFNSPSLFSPKTPQNSTGSRNVIVARPPRLRLVFIFCSYVMGTVRKVTFAVDLEEIMGLIALQILSPLYPSPNKRVQGVQLYCSKCLKFLDAVYPDIYWRHDPAFHNTNWDVGQVGSY